MGICASQADRDERDQSKAIDKKIQVDGKQLRQEFKILLLGMFIPL
jgi:hypothetical protein